LIFGRLEEMKFARVVLKLKGKENLGKDVGNIQFLRILSSSNTLSSKYATQLEGEKFVIIKFWNLKK
jgi:hypothetical protein